MTTSSWNASAATEPSFDPQATPAERTLDIRFTGSGSEYFRIWIVNLLLTIVTLSLYHPWAKVRRLRYFYGNTLVDGHALDFHGNPWKMLRGYLLVGAMVLLYSVAGKFSPVAGLVAFLIVAAIWPALFKASMQFRMGNTSWRGLRLRFKGSTAGAYRAMLPLFLPGLVVLVMVLGVPDPTQPPSWYLPSFLGAMLVAFLFMPWLLWSLKKYQHEHYALGQVQTCFKARVSSFYGVFLQTFGVTLLAGVVMAVVIAVLAVIGAATVMLGGKDMARNPVAAIMAGLFVGVIMMLVMQLLPRPFFESRLQNLVWGKTAAAQLQFKSALRFGPFFWLTVKNWFLMVFTIGLYWPFARVALARMRLEAVSLATTLDLDQLHEHLRLADGDAAGDAAGDLFGIDIGL